MEMCSPNCPMAIEYPSQAAATNIDEHAVKKPVYPENREKK